MTWVGAGVVVIAVAAAGWWWTQRDAAGGVSYRTAKIERGNLQAAVSSSGTVNPVSQVSVGSQVSGQIKEMLADFNTEVKKGQLIARIDPESFEYKMRQSSADLEAARAAVLNAQANINAVLASVSKSRLEADNAQRDLQRKQELLARQFISQADFENTRNSAGTTAELLKVVQAQLEVARAQAVSAQAVVRQREAALAQARVDLERTEIRSPVDGVVIKRSVDVGQTVAASLQAPELFIIARNLSDMQVEASIDEADIARVRGGQKVAFTIDAFPGRSFAGEVRQVRKAAVSAQNVVTYTVVVGFTNPNAALLPGMTANVRIITETRENVLKVPNAALRVRIAGVEPAASAPAGAAPVRSGAAGGWSWLGTAQAQPAGGGPGALRERLVAELRLDADQQGKLDAILADMRPRFAAVRELAEEDRAAAREKVQAELRERIGRILTPEQRDRYAQVQAARAGAPTGGAAAAAPASPASATAPPRPAQARAPAIAATTMPAASGTPARAASAAAEPRAAAAAQAAAAPTAAAPATTAAPAGAGGPLRDFRDRLIADLQLAPAQVEKVDAVLAEARPRFGELRSLPEEERGKARERILADLRARVGEQLTAEQKPKYQALLAELGSRQSTRGRIHLLGEGGKPVAVNVRLGITDGVATELIVTAGAPGAELLKEGATVITAVTNPNAPSATPRPAGSTGPRPPF
jgi:HlyD family secretion protein